MPNEAAPAATSAAFIHSRLDDLGLTPVQFRVYGHICRRAGQKGFFFESVPNCAGFCQVNIKTVRAAIARLSELGLIRLETCRPGETKAYRVTNIEEWPPLPIGYPGIAAGGVSNGEGTPPKRDRGSRVFKREATPTNPIPPKVIPGSSSPEVNPNKGESRPPVFNIESGPKITPAERITLEKELKTIEERKKKVYNSASHDAMGPIYTAKEKELRGRLLLREAEIKKKLGRQF